VKERKERRDGRKEREKDKREKKWRRRRRRERKEKKRKLAEPGSGSEGLQFCLNQCLSSFIHLSNTAPQTWEPSKCLLVAQRICPKVVCSGCHTKS
jgi:hypothetical protein